MPVARARRPCGRIGARQATIADDHAGEHRGNTEVQAVGRKDADARADRTRRSVGGPLNAMAPNEIHAASAVHAASEPGYNDGNSTWGKRPAPSRARAKLAVSLPALPCTLLLTWPLAADLAHLGRTLPTDADGQFSIWNIAWVARTLFADPLHLFDANIFHPHKLTLAYSEANVLPGAIGAPVWWLTRNPWLTLNVVFIFGFASAYVCAYLLFRELTGAPRRATCGAILYAFCPYVFSHLSHIQLLMTGGIPLSMLMLHRLVENFRLKAEAQASERSAGNQWRSGSRSPRRRFRARTTASSPD